MWFCLYMVEFSTKLLWAGLVQVFYVFLLRFSWLTSGQHTAAPTKEFYFHISFIILNDHHEVKRKQDGDLKSQARIRLSKDELRTDILSGDVQMTDDRWQMTDDRWQMTDDGWQMTDHGWQMADERSRMTDDGWQLAYSFW